MTETMQPHFVATHTVDKSKAFPLGSDITIATVSANGALTEQEDDSHMVPRIQLILKKFNKMNMQVFALQEPHLAEGSTSLESAKA